MGKKRVDQLTAATTVASTDLFPIATAAGTLRKVPPSSVLPYLDVRWYGAVGDGATDDTAAIQAAITAAAVAGGTVQFGTGTFIAANLLLASNVELRGVGVDATVLKLKNAANVDLLTNTNFATLTAGTTQGGISGFRLANMTLDGNRASNSSGWVMRVYGSKYSVDNVHFKNGKSGGVWTQWGIGGTNMEAHWVNFKIFNCEGNLLHNNGPHDSLYSNGSVFNDSTQPLTTGKLYVGGANTGGAQFTNAHFWGNCATAVEASEGHFFTNCQAEGASTQNVLFSTHGCVWTGGHIFGTNSVSQELGIKLGSSVAVTSCVVEGVQFSQFGASSYPVVWGVTGGGNTVTGTLRSSTCTAMAFGAKDASDVLSIADPGGTTPRVGIGVGDLAELPKIRTALWLPGAAGEYVSCPDVASLDIVGDLCLVALIAADDWTPSASQVIINKRASSSQFSYRLLLGGSGALQLGWSPTGADGAAVASTSSATSLSALAAGTWRYVAATLDVDNGASAYDVRFWTSLNGVTWTQYGTTNTGGATTSIFASTSVLEIGSTAVGTLNPFAGKVLLASVRSGIGAAGVVGGTEVARYDASIARGNRYRDPYGNTFTHNGTAWALADAA